MGISVSSRHLERVHSETGLTQSLIMTDSALLGWTMGRAVTISVRPPTEK